VKFPEVKRQILDISLQYPIVSNNFEEFRFLGVDPAW